MWCCSEMSRRQVSSFPQRRDEPFALARESLFFACAKKSNQKKAHPGGAPSALRAARLLAAPKGPHSRNSDSNRMLQGAKGLPRPISHFPSLVSGL